MIGRYTVTLDNKSLEAQYTYTVGKNTIRPIVILDVNYSGAQFQTKNHTTANQHGYEVSDFYCNKRTVSVTFQIREYDIAKRNSALTKVINWARLGGKLRTNDKTGMYLDVRCEHLPVIESVRNWLDTLKIVFSSVGVPFWQNEALSSLALTAGKSGKGTLKTTGNLTPECGGSPVAVTITAKANVTSIQLAVKSLTGTTKLILSGFKLTEGKVMTISYKNDRYLSIKVGSVAHMEYLQPSSSDMLLASCGTSVGNEASFSADGKIAVTFETRGLWL